MNSTLCDSVKYNLFSFVYKRSASYVQFNSGLQRLIHNGNTNFVLIENIYKLKILQQFHSA